MTSDPKRDTPSTDDKRQGDMGEGSLSEAMKEKKADPNVKGPKKVPVPSGSTKGGKDSAPPDGE